MFGLGAPELTVLLLLLGTFLLPGIIGSIIASKKGRSAFGWFVLCTILPILIVAAILIKPAREVPGKYRECPACKEIIKWEAVVCKYCQREIGAVAQAG